MKNSVLVIDDDVAFRGLARRMLADCGLTVVGEAGTAAEGSAAAMRLRPVAALVDVMLPDGDGVALATELAGLPWAPRVLLTSSAADLADVEVDRSGAVGFLPKQELPNAPLDRLLGSG